MYQGIPIIGIVGGVGSGKSYVAKMFGDYGCCVIHSDEQVALAYQQPAVREALRQRWGDATFNPDGTLNRKRVAERIFASTDERQWLEGVIHPVVAQLRDVTMAEAAATQPRPVAFIWDTPLLFEVGLHQQCDAVVFVETPLDVRLERVRRSRGWDAAELARRENSQWPLDKKRDLSHYTVTNAAESAASYPASAVPALPTDVKPPEAAENGNTTGSVGLRRQVCSVLSRVITVRRGSDGLDQQPGL